jgi:hypothetical protein
VDAGGAVRLDLLRGELTPGERERLDRLGVAPGAGGEPIAEAETIGATVVDVPDPDRGVDGIDPARLVVFDDRDAFGGRAAIVVQPSQPRWAGPGEAGAVLAGYAVAPVGEAYRRLRAAMDRDAPSGPPAGMRPRVVVCFGGSDPSDVTGRIAPVLAGDRRWTTELIVGSAYRDDEGPSADVVVRDPADLAERLATADLAVVGAGTMKFEVACLGRPAILLAVADDQLAVGGPYAATGAADYLGDGRTLDPGVVREAVARLLEDPGRRRAMARVAFELVDGDGAGRVARAVLAVATGAPR